MNTIELEDVQGYVIRGYSKMKFSKFALLKVTNAKKAKKWINKISGSLTNASIVSRDQLPKTCLNLAFAPKGLAKLGLSTKNINTFSPPFKEGMVTHHRSRLLGDIDSSSPDHWIWGGKNGPEPEILLLVFGKTEKNCKKYYTKLKKEFSKGGLEKVRNFDGQTLKDNKEHFGFRDGISQPIIKGSGRTGPEFHCVNPGEFILGYKNNYNVYPDSPRIVCEQGDVNLLPPTALTGEKDLGKNGTYFIVRQMQENVKDFWDFMNEKTKKDGKVNEEESIKLAARMIGRWPSGAPLTKYPNKDPIKPGEVSDENDFLYAEDDSDGRKCPFGSHVRRMNPRDSFENDGEKESKKLSNRHRLIRRARSYGEPIIGTPRVKKPKKPVGIYFNCFAADIGRQFEFLQYTWSNYPKIKQLYNDPDPIIGVLENPIKGNEQIFTIQDKEVNKTVKGIKRFIKIKGGAYFFFPSITTVRYLTTIENPKKK